MAKQPPLSPSRNNVIRDVQTRINTGDNMVPSQGSYARTKGDERSRGLQSPEGVAMTDSAAEFSHHGQSNGSQAMRDTRGGGSHLHSSGKKDSVAYKQY